MHIPLVAPAWPAERRKIRIILTRKDIFFHTGISFSALKKKKKENLSRPSNKALTIACSQWETATTLNCCSLQWTFVQNNPPQFPPNLVKADFPFVSSDLPVVHHSLHVPYCNSPAISKYARFSSNISGYFIFNVDKMNESIEEERSSLQQNDS